MKRRSDLRTMKDVLEIRGVQRLAAEARLAQAASEVRAVEDEQTQAAERLRRDQAGWGATVSGPSMDMDLARAWASAVLDGLDASRLLQDRARQAARRRADRAGELQVATARRDAAEEIARKVRAAVRQREEEAALVAAAERFSFRSRRP